MLGAPVPRRLPSPSCRRRVFDTTWGGGTREAATTVVHSALGSSPPPLAPPHPGEGDHVGVRRQSIRRSAAEGSPRSTRWRWSASPDRARAAAGQPTRGIESKIRAAGFRAQSRPATRRRRQGRAGQAPVRGHRLSATGTVACTVLPRPQALLQRRGDHRQGRDRQAPRASYADALERRLEPAAVLGRPGGEPGGADAAFPSSTPTRWPPHWKAGSALAARELRRSFAQAFPQDPGSRPTTSPRRWRPTSARSCRRRRGSTMGRRRCGCLTPAELSGLSSSPARGAASAATSASPSPTTTSTTSACRRGPGPRRRWACPPPTTPSRRRRCVSSPGRPPTCTTARSAAWRRGAHLREGRRRPPDASKDLPKQHRLTDAERADLVAFLETLSSETPPQPSTEAWVGGGQPVSRRAWRYDGREPARQNVHVRSACASGRAEADRAQRRHAHP